MTSEQIGNLKVGDRLIGPTNHKAEVVRRTALGVRIRFNDNEEKHYSLSSPKLQNFTFIGSREIGEPWLTGGERPKTPKRRTGGRGPGRL